MSARKPATALLNAPAQQGLLPAAGPSPRSKAASPEAVVAAQEAYQLQLKRLHRSYLLLKEGQLFIRCPRGSNQELSYPIHEVFLRGDVRQVARFARREYYLSSGRYRASGLAPAHRKA